VPPARDLGQSEALQRELRELCSAPQRLRLRKLSLLTEQLAKLGDIHLQRLYGRLGRLLFPGRVDEPLAGDNPVCLEKQQGEDRPLLLPVKSERTPVCEHVEWTENPELHPLHRLYRAPVRLATNGAATDPAQTSKRRPRLSSDARET
jgi:hypothetical protein